MDPIKLTRKQAKLILDKTFPEYPGRKIKVEFTTRVTFYDTNWGGGTRNWYHALRADGNNTRLMASAPWINPVEGKTIELPVDVIVVEHSVFCGHDTGITIYAHPSNAPKWLTA